MSYNMRAGSSRGNFLSFTAKGLPMGYVLSEAYNFGNMLLVLLYGQVQFVIPCRLSPLIKFINLEWISS